MANILFVLCYYEYLFTLDNSGTGSTIMVEEYYKSMKRINEFRVFVREYIHPYAAQIDKDEYMSKNFIHQLGRTGYLGAIIPKQYNGIGMDMLTFGVLLEEIGKESSAILSLFTVHGMFITALIKWGTEEQKINYLPKLAKGELIGALALTEPNIGSDASNLETTAIASGDDYIINGKKKWISIGQHADVFLVIAMVEGKATAFIIERGWQGFDTLAISGMLGFRGAMLAELNIERCKIPNENLVGRIGFGFTHVAGTSLDYGRYCVAWGALGLATSCLYACIDYTKTRKQFGQLIRKHQLIQGMIADMETDIEAGRLICIKAGYEKTTGNPEAIMTTTKAKYFLSKILKNITNDAVQIHGANGCCNCFPVERYYRDAKIFEIIEGSNQMQQLMISSYAYQRDKKIK